MNNHYEIVIIGSGPAGMAASEIAAEAGSRILILDEQEQPGGQIYRGIASSSSVPGTDSDQSVTNGRSLIKRFRGLNVDYIPGATVWLVSDKREIGYSKEGVSHLLVADQVIIATGAQERPIPIPGWTLPGVMTVSAAQILLKDDGLALENAVFAGTGPLLYAAAHQYVQGGIPIKAILDLTPRKNYLRALPYLLKAVPKLSKIAEGWLWKHQILRSGLQYIKWVSQIKISGEKSAAAVCYRCHNHWEKIDAQHILLHLGIVPNVNIFSAIGCKTIWDTSQLCWRVSIDSWCRTSVPGIFAAGDGANITGAIAAEQYGRLAALEALRNLGRISSTLRNHTARSSRKILKKELSIRPFLETLFKPSANFRLPKDRQTIVCRCEEVTTGEIEKIVDLGCKGPNQVKSYSRCGMGPCQGRFCGTTVSELIARQLKKPPSSVGYFRLRPPLKPLLLNELMMLQNDKKPGKEPQ